MNDHVNGGVEGNETPPPTITTSELDILQGVLATATPVHDLQDLPVMAPYESQQEVREALDLTFELMRNGAEALGMAREHLLEISQRRGWETLGYQDINAFLLGEAQGLLVDLEAEARKHLIVALSLAGASDRTVAKVIGMSHVTVGRNFREMLARGDVPRQLPGPEGHGNDPEPTDRAHTPLPPPGEVITPEPIIHPPARSQRRPDLPKVVHRQVTNSQDYMRKALHSLEDDRAARNVEYLKTLTPQVKDLLRMAQEFLAKVDTE